MKDKLLQLFPEIGLIGNAALQKNVIDTYIAALEQGNWKVKELCELPFTLDFPEFIFSYADHVHGVTQISAEAAKAFNRTYASNKKYQVNVDLTIAGALLHDVGKLLEYERSENGYFRKTAYGRALRHPVSGAILAHACGCPKELCHIIAVHAAEGDCSIRSPEAIIVNKADFINFDIINSLRGSNT